MSRRRKTRKSLVGRNLLTPQIPIARRSLPRQSIRSLNEVLLDIARLSGQLDNRRFTPQKHLRPARTVSGLISPVKIQSPKRAPLAKAREYFSHPLTATPCVRRKQRKEVIFAKGHSGRNGMRKRRHTPTSNIGC